MGPTAEGADPDPTREVSATRCGEYDIRVRVFDAVVVVVLGIIGEVCEDIVGDMGEVRVIVEVTVGEFEPTLKLVAGTAMSSSPYHLFQ